MRKLTLVLLFIYSLAAQNYTVSGSILDKESNEPLMSANIYLKGTSLGAISDENGFYFISKIEKGKFTLIVDYVGYKKVQKELEFNSSKKVEFDIYLERSMLRAESIVVTAARQKQFMRDVPVMVNVADEFTFNTSQSINLAEGLNFMPAVRVENNCQNCGFTQVRLNGMDGSYAQILIDGRQIFSALNGVYGLEQIPKSMIKQIEVIRGGGSSMYGSNAIAGIINVITAEALSNTYNFDMNHAFIDGSTSDQSYSMNTSFVDEDRTLGLALFGTIRDRDPWDANNDTFTEITRLESRSFGLQAYTRPSTLSKITLNYHHMYEDRRGGNQLHLKPHLADLAEATTHFVDGGTFKYEQYFSNQSESRFSLYGSYQYTDRDSYYGGGQDPNAYGDTSEKVAIGGIEFSNQFGNHLLVTGFEKNYSRLSDHKVNGVGITQDITQYGLFIQDDWAIDDALTLSLGLRLDNHNRISKNILSPRLNALYKINDKLQFRASYAEGFRAPQAFDEDLHISSVGSQKFHHSVISKDLKPEYSKSISVSFDYSNDKAALPWGLTLEGFYTRLTDVFTNTFLKETSNYVVYEKVNGDAAKVIGATLEFRSFFNRDIEFQAGVTVQKSEYDNVTDIDGLETKEFFRTPRLYGFFLSKYSVYEHLDLSLSGTLTGSMKAPHYSGFISNSRIETTKALFETNLKIEYEIDYFGHDNTVLLSTGVQNLFNSIQDDFDKGPDRDSAYIYGPSRPRTYYVAVDIAL